MSYQPKTGERCSCKRGIERDNCPTCEGTGQVIDFARIRARAQEAAKPAPIMDDEDAHAREVSRLRSIIEDLLCFTADIAGHTEDDLAHAHRPDCPVCRAQVALGRREP